ncbi:MAG: thioredoxin fold domain-containing protein [Calditrichaeota bacterium]|nr:thioredoxin fold domain-containing protein [Calditrichota bacterium]
MKSKFFVTGLILLLLFVGENNLIAQNPFDVKIVTVTAKAVPDTVFPASATAIEVVATIEPEFHINSNKPTEEYLIPTVVKFEPIAGVNFGETKYPKAKEAKFSFSEEPLSVYEGKITVKTSAEITQAVTIGKQIIKGSFSFQACNDVNCFAPQTLNFAVPIFVAEKKGAAAEVKAVAATPGEQASNASIVAGEIVKQEQPEQAVEFTSDELRAKRVLEKGLPYAILAFFIFGLAINLTPCVYPVIPLTVGYFGGQSGRSKGSAFVMALFYVVGIALVFAALGLISGLAGKQWGFLFQSSWFVIAVTVIILAMAASMFGAFEITIPAWLSSSLGKSREGNIGALVMGLTVGVVIAPCAAGIIIGLVGLVAKLGIVAKGTLLFFVMGLGLGVPYLFLATFSGLLNKLPQSGMWMVWIRKLFGVLLVGVALYFFLPQAKHVPNMSNFFFGLLAIFGGLLLGFLDHAPGYTKNFKIGRGIFGILVILLGIFLVNSSLTEKKAGINWIHYEQGTVEQLAAPGKPVFLDFYADWCAPCKEMDRKTFSDKKVIEKAKEFTMIKIDCTKPNETVKKFKAHWGVTGMPTFIFIDKNGNEVKDLRAIGFVGADKFLKMMEKGTK